IAVVRLSLRRINMKPPPPRLPAAGCVTASANATAIAASTALPPRLMMSTPTRDATSFVDATIPCFARTGSRAAASGAFAKTSATIKAIGLIVRIVFIFAFVLLVYQTHRLDRVAASRGASIPLVQPLLRVYRELRFARSIHRTRPSRDRARVYRLQTNTLRRAVAPQPV